MDPPKAIAVPLKLDAFVLNAAVCGGSSTDPNQDENRDKAKIAPLSQPNYSFLRFERPMVQNDILSFINLQKTGPAPFNPRLTDLHTGKLRPNRQGVYLHWMVPRPYRTGSTLSSSEKEDERSRNEKGFAVNSASPPEGVDTAAPDFRPVPPRWLVIRKVDECYPRDALPKIDAWVVESDRRHELDEIPTTADIQVDYSPYVVGTDPESLDNKMLNKQAEIFIGHKEHATTWAETVDDPSKEQPPRVELNLLGSSNQLFADYQPHNSNVFSIIDTLQYIGDDGGDPQVVTSAKVSYYVLGWHSRSDKDPFGVLSGVNRGKRLEALGMVLGQTDDTTDAGIKAWLESEEPTRVVCHGAMYGVQWESRKKPRIVPADRCHELLNRQMPVSIGATPEDALLAYIQGCNNGVDQDLLRAQKLLHTSGDSVDDLDEADSAIINSSFANSAGGSFFFLSTSNSDAEGQNPTKPAKEYIEALDLLNNRQQYLDGLQRELRVCRWDMFAFWWQYMTNVAEPNPNETKTEVEAKTAAIEKLTEQINAAAAAVEEAKAKLPTGLVRSGALPPFRMVRDPTLLVAGVESGWPYDYLQQLRVRLDTQILSTAPKDREWAKFCSDILSKLPSTLQGVAGRLVGEFVALDPEAEPPSPSYCAPLYHDIDKSHLLPDGTAPWRDRWGGRQAWFPLFLEWEAEYTHVPHNERTAYWTLEQRSAWQPEPKTLRHGIDPNVDLARRSLNDKRTLSGRVLMLPQLNASLEAMVTQLVDTVAGDWVADYGGDRLRELLYGQPFLSCPLSGFVHHLLTRVQGNHVKPTLRAEGDVAPFDAAIRAGEEAGFGEQQLRMMGLETSVTPYGTLVPYLDPQFCPFKPATHGQFRFTALNIIDKFGQVIHAIDPSPTADNDGPPPLYPHIGERYRPGPLGTDPTRANTVKADGPGLCQYAQLPPSINQPARLNGAFVDYFADDGWRPLGEWDDGFVWGWIVPNFADSGIQLFLPDGTFFRELRRGAESPVWLPFEPPQLTPNAHQLQRFANQLANGHYLDEFMTMLDAATAAAAAPPTAAASFLSLLVGRPLALVKLGFSLELATAPLANTSTITGPPTTPAQLLRHYRFAMQLGDANDGLVAYFLPADKPSPSDALQLDSLFTHHVANAGDPSHPHTHLKKIGPPNHPKLAPFWVDPSTAEARGDDDDDTPQAAYRRRRDRKLRAFGALIDPFAPLHASTGGVDVVPAFDPARMLRPGYDLDQDAQQLLQGPSIGVPGLRGGEWAWLQPYSVAGGDDDDGSGGGVGGEARTAYMALPMKTVDQRPRFEPAPYTAVEGYMQLRQGISGAEP